MISYHESQNITIVWQTLGGREHGSKKTKEFVEHGKFSYTTNPTDRSAAATECSTSESDLESPVESHQALAERLPSAQQTCSTIARRALSGILQMILNHFRSASARFGSCSAIACRALVGISGVGFYSLMGFHPFL